MKGEFAAEFVVASIIFLTAAVVILYSVYSRIPILEIEGDLNNTFSEVYRISDLIIEDHSNNGILIINKLPNAWMNKCNIEGNINHHRNFYEKYSENLILNIRLYDDGNIIKCEEPFKNENLNRIIIERYVNSKDAVNSSGSKIVKIEFEAAYL